jgi:hypothetical protein
MNRKSFDRFILRRPPPLDWNRVFVARHLMRIPRPEKPPPDRNKRAPDVWSPCVISRVESHGCYQTLSAQTKRHPLRLCTASRRRGGVYIEVSVGFLVFRMLHLGPFKISCRSLKLGSDSMSGRPPIIRACVQVARSPKGCVSRDWPLVPRTRQEECFRTLARFWPPLRAVWSRISYRRAYS